MLNKIYINKDDIKQEKKCKRIYNNNYFGQFRDNYEKFKQYSQQIGSYDSMKYVSEKYSYYFIKENYPEFIEQEQYFEVDYLGIYV